MLRLWLTILKLRYDDKVYVITQPFWKLPPFCSVDLLRKSYIAEYFSHFLHLENYRIDNRIDSVSNQYNEAEGCDFFISKLILIQICTDDLLILKKMKNLSFVSLKSICLQ